MLTRMPLPAPLVADELCRAVKLPRRAACSAGITPSQRHVAIVGAGAAGLATALGLSRRGIAVTILEAGQRVGGRIRTVEVGGQPYDLGATWAHGRSAEVNPALAFATRLPLRSSGGAPKTGKTGARTVFGTDGSEVDGRVASRLASAYALALEECEGVAHGKVPEELQGTKDAELPHNVEAAVEKLLARRFSDAAAAGAPSASFLRAAYDWRAQLECCISGCDAVSDLSLEAWGEYEDLPHAVRASNRWQGGFGALMQAALDDLLDTSSSAGDVDIRFGCSVECIRWSEDGVQLTARSSNDSSEVCLHADQVVVTTSLGVLKDSVASGRPLCFEPPLPEPKRAAIERLGFGTVDKVLLLYEQPWWSDLWAALRFLWPEELANNEDPAWLRRIYGCTGACDNAGLEFWLAGTGATDMEACSDQEVQESLQRLLQRCSGASSTLPEPSGLKRSSWGGDPNFLGSYSFVAVGGSGADIDELGRPEGRFREFLA
ncbi:Spermine oxidase [Symbiodinium microadriaticum]|uniref:Spermine oxidase n=1 Tax=Symbiodinium microadriaticum TaxID=2951 RepID=A0A1Q9EFG4_SYMMI|nr:Spermine oxidase [Symbiodinium microadriaticum]